MEDHKLKARLLKSLIDAIDLHPKKQKEMESEPDSLESEGAKLSDDGSDADDEGSDSMLASLLKKKDEDEEDESRF